MSILVDTNIIIDYLHNRSAALRLINTMRSKPSVSVVSITELYAGAASRLEERQIEHMVRGSHVLSVTLDIARSAGQHLKHYARSIGLDDLDAIIAATAEHHGLGLATLNVKHFPMLKGLKRAY